MKKLILAIAMSSSLAAFGQGTVNFVNSSSTSPIKIDGVNATGANGVKVQLYYAANNTDLASLTSTVTLNTANGAIDLAGLGTGWTVMSGAASSVGVPLAGLFPSATKTTGNEIGGGSTIYLQVRGWNGGYADWASAVAAVNSGANVWAAWTSVPWLNNTGNPNGQPTPTAPAAMLLGTGGFQGLNLTKLAPVPEPTTFALAGLAGAAMLIFRRRK